MNAVIPITAAPGTQPVVRPDGVNRASELESRDVRRLGRGNVVRDAAGAKQGVRRVDGRCLDSHTHLPRPCREVGQLDQLDYLRRPVAMKG